MVLNPNRPKHKKDLVSFRVFEVENSEALREWKARYASTKGYTHKTMIRRVKADGAFLDVVAAIARRS